MNMNRKVLYGVVISGIGLPVKKVMSTMRKASDEYQTVQHRGPINLSSSENTEIAQIDNSSDLVAWLVANADEFIRFLFTQIAQQQI